MPNQRRHERRPSSASWDPNRVWLPDLLYPPHVAESLDIIRHDLGSNAYIFVFMGQDLVPIEETYGQPVPEPPSDDVQALVTRVRDGGIENYAYTDDGSLIIGHPIWLHYEVDPRWQSTMKGCFVLMPRGKVADCRPLLMMTKLFADSFSERATICHHFDAALRRCESLDRQLKLGTNALSPVIDSIGAALLLINRDKRIAWHNEVVSTNVGGSLEGRPCCEFVYGDGGSCDDCLVRRTFAEAQPQIASIATDWRDQGVRHFNITATPVFGPSGQVDQVLMFVSDVTYAHTTEVELTQYKRLVNNSDDFMLTCGDNGAIRVVNRKITDELGYAESELVGRNVGCLFGDCEQEKARELASRARSAGMAMDLVHIRRKEGAFVPTQVFVTYDADHKIFQSVFRDISERLHMENEIRRRSEQVHAQNKKITAAAHERNQFYRSVSHELRTPLTSVVGFAKMMLEDIDEPLTANQRRHMDKVITSAHKLLGLVNDLLDLSKLEALRVEPVVAKVKVGEVLSRVVGSIIPLAMEKSLAISIDVPDDLPDMVTDEQKLGHIVSNLVSNAIKFTNEGSVLVSATAGLDTIIISVQDTGVGIPQEETRAIFKEFRQGSTQGSGQRGTGLGLAIAQRLALLLGGSIRVKSKVGVGSTFTLKLPTILPGAANSD